MLRERTVNSVRALEGFFSHLLRVLALPLRFVLATWLERLWADILVSLSDASPCLSVLCLTLILLYRVALVVPDGTFPGD